jgi:acetolactate synthase-1/2/3 large subunit
MKCSEVIKVIEKSLPAKADVFVDAGNTGAFVIHGLRLSGEGVFYVSLGMGGMGNSIGAAIGSCLYTRRQTYVFIGDGSFLMHGLEIHTAREHQLPLVLFILNNNSHAMCSTREEVFSNGETGLNNFLPSHFGRGFDQIFPGMKCFEVNTIAELEEKMIQIINPKGPTIISINIDKKELPPFNSFIKK